MAAVPVVGNHNQQRNHVNANFEGSSSHLAILYEPLLGTFSKCFRVFIHFHIIQIVLYSFVLYFQSDNLHWQLCSSMTHV
jgi:hypothetical protein